MEYTYPTLYEICLVCVCENEGFISLRCGRFGKIHQWIDWHLTSFLGTIEITIANQNNGMG